MTFTTPFWKEDDEWLRQHKIGPLSAEEEQAKVEAEAAHLKEELRQSHGASRAIILCSLTTLAVIGLCFAWPTLMRWAAGLWSQ